MQTHIFVLLLVCRLNRDEGLKLCLYSSVVTVNQTVCIHLLVSIKGDSSVKAWLGRRPRCLCICFSLVLYFIIVMGGFIFRSCQYNLGPFSLGGIM